MSLRTSHVPFGKWMVLISLVVGLGCFLMYSPVKFAQAQDQSTASEGEVKQEQAKQTEEAKPQETEESKPQETEEAKPQVTEEAPPQAEQEAQPEQEAEEAESGEFDNQSCIDCHNPDILEWSKEDKLDNVIVEDEPAPPRKKPPFVMGELNLSIDEEKYGESVHADTMCIDCHYDIEEIPHKQRLKSVNCADCHDTEAVAESAHGEKEGAKSPGCIGCHDVHYSQGAGAEEDKWQEKLCVDCHNAYGLDTVAAHKHLYEPGLHMAKGCMICHQGEEEGVHYIPRVETKVAQCEDCHSKYTILSADKYEPKGFWNYIFISEWLNADAMKEYGYVVGAHRVPLLDLVLVLIVLGPLGLPIVHGGLRILTRRKEPVELPEEKILLHPLVERIWHWVQALCIVVLIITGVIIHWPEAFTGWFDWAVTVHNWFGWLTVIVWLVWLIYNLGSGRIKHYIPTREDVPKGMIVQAKFYGYGIFKHEPHPYAPSEDNKFNPLQKFAYLKFQLFLFPILLISGLLYMYPVEFKGIIDAIGGMTVLATIHYILAALFAAFLMAHLYLATTGETIGENFKAIITGYGIKADHDHHHA